MAIPLGKTGVTQRTRLTVAVEKGEKNPKEQQGVYVRSFRTMLAQDLVTVRHEGRVISMKCRYRSTSIPCI
jgi:hypothetical protein